MPRLRQCRNAHRACVTVVIGCAVVVSSSHTALATPHVRLLPQVSPISPNGSVEIGVFIEEVVDLKLYEIVLQVAGGSSGSLDLTDLVIDEARGDFVFAGISPLVCLPNPDNLRITCSPLSDDCVTVATPPAYLGTFTFTASPDAHGVFDISIVAEPTSFLLDCIGDSITPFTLNGATVGVEVAIPTTSEWGMIVMTLLTCTVGTLILRRRRAGVLSCARA